MPSTLPTKQTFTAPVPFSVRSSATSESRLTAGVTNTGALQDNLYEYLDRDGATYPGALNNGLDHAYLANRAARPQNVDLDDTLTKPASGTIVLSTSYQTLFSWSVTTPIDQCNVHIHSQLFAFLTVASIRRFLVRLKRDATIVEFNTDAVPYKFDLETTGINRGQHFSPNWLDQVPTAGTYTYTIEGSVDTTASGTAAYLSFGRGQSMATHFITSY